MDRLKAVRAFIAVDIGDEVRDNLGRLTERLRRSDADVKWVRLGAMHLTLRFLGEIGPDRLDALDAVLAEAARTQGPASLEAVGWGTFPDLRRPRVIWVGLPGGQAKLGLAAAALERGLVAAGFGPADKPFSPHLTLGRAKSQRGMAALLKLLEKETGRSYGVISADRLVLYQSVLQSAGAVYTPLRERKFSG